MGQGGTQTTDGTLKVADPTKSWEEYYLIARASGLAVSLLVERAQPVSQDVSGFTPDTVTWARPILTGFISAVG